MSGTVRSFPPLARSDARVLILGSMPGQASLDAQRYYAHPQNAFWRILGELAGFAPDAAYNERVAALLNARIAVWDVLQSCVRPGSLDSAIAADSIVPNDFAGFFALHPQIARIGFNGATAQRLFRLHVQPTLAGGDRIELLRLPSTSPAHAGVPYARKLAAWRAWLAPDVRSKPSRIVRASTDPQ